MYIYLGDGDVSGAAAYLSAVMLHSDIPFDRVDGGKSPADNFISKKYKAYIISDYERSNFKPGQLEHIRDAVREGSGLLMIGGWNSFRGMSGEYNRSPLAEVLPVEMLDEDDRRNFTQPTLVYRKREHPILDNLPWDCPPFIGGFNEFRAKKDGLTLLSSFCTDFRISRTPADKNKNISISENDFLSFSLTKRYPLLVVGSYHQGRAAALATDVAPHWVGGFVDWGRQRISQVVYDGENVEVGADYARFFAQLVRWTGREI